MSYQSLKDECLAAYLARPRTGLVVLKFGNASVADPERRVFAMKPNGVDYDQLSAHDMVVLDYEGHVIEGNLRPSSDTVTHRCLFLNFPGTRPFVR